MRVAIALGGDALLKQGEPPTAAVQRANVRAAAAALASVAWHHQIVLDVVGTAAEGTIGYVLEQELGNLLPVEVPFATLLTMVEVDRGDPAEPQRIVEIRPIRWLLDKGVVVICSGGIPTVCAADADRMLVGVDAVVDTDLASELLAREVDADLFVMVSDDDGSGGPKVAAATRFVERTGRRAAVGGLSQIEEIVDGTAGTQLLPDSAG